MHYIFCAHSTGFEKQQNGEMPYTLQNVFILSEINLFWEKHGSSINELSLGNYTGYHTMNE